MVDPGIFCGEAHLRKLATPSPACRNKVGQRIGRTIVDKYGDKVMAGQLPGDTWLEADRLGGDHDVQEMGPVERKLLQYGNLVGLVVGAFGEGSEDLHSLVQSLAESKVNAMGLRRGGQASDEELGIVIGQIRRSLSTTFVRAQAQCLLSRLNCTGQGFAQAFKRRNWAIVEDERMRKERSAQWIGRDRGRNLVRRGQFLLA